jgi:hypothetical protein
VALVPRSRTNTRPGKRSATTSDARRVHGAAGLSDLLLALDRGLREPGGWFDYQGQLSKRLETAPLLKSAPRVTR